MTYKIAIVEDMPRALRSLLNDLTQFPEIEVVLTAANGDDYLSQLKALPKSHHPQVVIMDLDMPIMNGIEAVAISAELYPAINYIMLTVTEDDDKLFSAIRAGAHGYLLKEETAKTIVSSIKEVVDRLGSPMSPRIARKTLKLLTSVSLPKEEAKPEKILSAREIEILKKLVDGNDYKEIAELLFISPNTVRNHIANIYEKLHVTSKAQAVKLAIKNNWH
ncbi:MAG: response regulator transcription factor [Pedobacter sp.]|nr:response regulator transcription factor [Cellulomonas sp.]MDQ8052262.1 response regulator transcription factor [Pedobacter sp.]